MLFKHIKISALIAGILLLFVSCEIFDYHPLHHKAYSFDDKEINDRHISFPDSHMIMKDTICFAFVSDTHSDYKKTQHFVKHINERDDINIVIHGGDFTNFGLRKEFEKFHSIFSKLECPYFVLIGNHDMLGSGYNLFKELYGSDNFSITFRREYAFGSRAPIEIISLNTNMLEGGLQQNPIDYVESWLSFIPEKAIIVMHAPPGSEQFNDNAEVERFGTILNKYADKIMFCVHGHQHVYSENDFYDNGIRFYGCDNIGKGTYLLFKVTKNGYTYERVAF